MDVVRQTISKWEGNETSPNIQQAQKLSELLDVEIMALLGIEETKTPDRQADQLAGFLMKVCKWLGIGILIYMTLLLLFMIFGGIGFGNASEIKVETSEHVEEVMM